ncbi:5'-3' exoribonuclease 3-like isoform X1 [Carica papaya]|uniref:5'-3' exoribonuclease 3-like isoform X1 n=1 Tax=Carica papaya TaxID=3649 RepID=UPI000B8CC7AF|nr:5'-3' exoribonuclease 3-like isoform X1 [Carica papaya]
MHYYYEGVCSWQWFYPYHYAPFASDLKELEQLDISFELGFPFKPFNQLLGVFPAASAHALPEHYRKLMTDPKSPIIDFYPTDFEVDMNGKRYSWQGIAKLPFIDESRLLAEVAKVENTLTEEEVRRNSRMFDMIFVGTSHCLSEYIFSLDNRCKKLSYRERIGVKEKLNPDLRDGMNGYISPCAGDARPSIFRSPIESMEDISGNEVICALYKLPDAHKHIPRPPSGVMFPQKIVQLGDLKDEPVLWHEESMRKPWNRERQKYQFGEASHQKKPCHRERKNHPGAISGHQLGEASHRLVINSLQLKNQVHHKTEPPGTDYSDISETCTSRPNFQTQYAHGYDKQRRVSASHAQQTGYHPHRRRDNYPAENSREYSRPVSYPSDYNDQNNGPSDVNQNTASVLEDVAYPSLKGGYAGNHRHHSHRFGSFWHLGDGQPQQVNEHAPRGHDDFDKQGKSNNCSGRRNRQQRGNYQSGNQQNNRYSGLRHKSK